MKDIVAHIWSLDNKRALSFYAQATQDGHKVFLLVECCEEHYHKHYVEIISSYKKEVKRLSEEYGILPEKVEIVLTAKNPLQWVIENMKPELLISCGKWFTREIAEYKTLKGVKVLGSYKNGWERRTKKWLIDNS